MPSWPMDFRTRIHENLQRLATQPVLGEVRGDVLHTVRGAELLGMVAQARSRLRAAGLRPGDRCALLGHNSLRWVAADLALMAEGIVVVPLYARQAAPELAAMLRDCTPKLLLCGDAALASAIAQALPEGPPRMLFEQLFDGPLAPGPHAPPLPRSPSDPVTIIYTSGTSGEPKGVVLNQANLNFMLPCTMARLDQLMGHRSQPDRVFHYLPCNFAGSWILLLTSLSRNSTLLFSTDLQRLAEEIRLAQPHYFLNVPALLERVRRGIEARLAERGGLVQKLFVRARAAWFGADSNARGLSDRWWLGLASTLIFPNIRRAFGPNLRALICGSAPLAVETQRFFQMLGIPVLQVYGLTETTAICTMDDPRAVEPGYVGPAVPGIEMRLGEGDEILVRGPNIFPGYWNRPEETARVLRDSWFHTGDQGEVNARGNWRILGRVKNILVLSSGHNVAPEPLEDELLRRLEGAQQVVLVGHGRSYLVALVTGAVRPEQVEQALAAMNAALPHYKQIRGFVLVPEPFTIENGLLTANGKLRREAVLARYAAQVEATYQRSSAAGRA
ncbi:MAG: AMP-binding protein [Firmicutes bacterium]|nr:AMP-binding protein [Bacillota bacterium]